MTPRPVLSTVRLWKWSAGAGLLLFVIIANLIVAHAPRTAEGGLPAEHPIVKPGLMYQGNASCTGSKCHTADEATEQSGQMIGDESIIWADKDPHAHAYVSLSDETSKKIAAALKIADAATSDRCLECHAMNAPAAQRGEGFAITDSVGCESCHGPGEKYLSPHAEAGWTMQQRGKVDAAGLFKEFGLLDTANLAVRAQVCVACHLQLDKDMIDAGHPPLAFEMYEYNYYISKNPDKEFARHWDDPTGEMRDAQLWATGQAAALVAAQTQVKDWKAKGWDTADAEGLVKLYQAGLDIAKKHFGAADLEGLTKAQYTPEKCAAAAADLAAQAGVPTNALQRRVLAFGVTALGSAAFDGAGKEAPDAFWAAYDTAFSAEGADYAAALKAMADAAK